MQKFAEPSAESEKETTSCPLCKSSNDSIIHTFGELHVVLCQVCGLRYLNPRIKEAVMKERYERRSYFSGISASGYDDYYMQEISLRLTFRRFLKNLKKFVPQAQNLLEVGCGYGFFLDEAKDFFPRRTGVELSAEAGMTAQETSGARVHIGSAFSLPPEIKDFDIIIMINVIEHIYDPVPLLLSLRERLTAGGMLALATPDIGSFWYKIMKKRWPSFKVPEHIAFYDKKTLSNLLNKAGFQPAGTIPYSHAFPMGVISKKFGINLPGGLAGKILWLPQVMLALCGRK
jgi:SAM-dependent methyltransferase